MDGGRTSSRSSIAPDKVIMPATLYCCAARPLTLPKAPTHHAAGYHSSDLVECDCPTGLELVPLPWVRLLPPIQPNTAVYLVLRNLTEAALHILATESPVARTAELYEHVQDVAGMMRMPSPGHRHPSARRGETGARRDAGPVPGTVVSLGGARRVPGGLRLFPYHDPGNHRAGPDATHTRGTHRGPQASPPGLYTGLHRPARREFPRRGTDPTRPFLSAENPLHQPLAVPGCLKLTILPERVRTLGKLLATDAKYHSNFSPTIGTHRKRGSREFATWITVRGRA